ncbi:MAG: ATP-binding protein [Myxococcota bacterium]
MLPLPALLVDAQGYIVFANAMARPLIGQPHDGAGKLRVRELLVPDRTVHDDPWSHADPQCLSPYPMTIQMSQGGTRAVDVYLNRVMVGPSSGWLVLLIDAPWTHEPVDLLARLRLQEERMTLATEAAQIGVFDRVIADKDPPPSYWSPSMRAMLGYPMDVDADSHWFLERLYPRDRARLLVDIARASNPRGDGRADSEVRWQHPDGEERYLLIRSCRVFAERDGQRVSVRTIGVVMDITERRRAEWALRLRSEVLDVTPDLVSISDTLGRQVYLNRSGRAMLGLPLDAPLTRDDMLGAYPPECMQIFVEQAIPAAVRHGVWSAEVEFPLPSGKRVPMSQCVLAHRHESEEITHYSMVSRDLSRERELEAQVLHSQKMEAIGRLAGGVAHDFNNLLSIIMSGCDLAMADLDPDHPARKEIHEVFNAAEQAAAVTTQLLAFSRKQILRPQVLDINAVLVEFTSMLEHLIDDTIEVRVVPSDAIPNIRADHGQLQQVVLNLVVNARDAMPEGGRLTIETRSVVIDPKRATSLELKPGRYVRLKVSDTGHGMTPTVKARIFEPFFTTKDPSHGTGLGLATVFGIVRQSGGDIRVHSEPGVGTTFEIDFPATDERTGVRPAAQRSVNPAGSGTVVLVEDDVRLRDVISRLLHQGGYGVMIANTPQEAIDMARRHAQFDVLLTDVLMPGMTGPQLAAALGEIRPEVVVVYMSGYTEDTIVHHGVLDDGVNFLTKPVTAASLFDALARALDRCQGEQSERPEPPEQPEQPHPVS